MIVKHNSRALAILTKNLALVRGLARSYWMDLVNSETVHAIKSGTETIEEEVSPRRLRGMEWEIAADRVIVHGWGEDVDHEPLTFYERLSKIGSYSFKKLS